MPAAKTESRPAAAPDLLISAFEIIAETGWRGFTFTELSDRAGLPLQQVRQTFSGRASLLDELSGRLDRAMLAFDPAEMESLPPRDRVFELVMSRLEAMAPFRSGVRRLMQDARVDPPLVAMTACRMDRSLAWMQDAAGLAHGRRASRLCGLRRRLQRRLLGAIYLQTLNVWWSDDSADLAKTMASLDKQLRRIESLAGLAPNAKAEGAAADAA